MPNRSRLAVLAAALAVATIQATRADPAPFDLAGPNLEVQVTRGSAVLPAGQVPNLVAGDRVWLKADLPAAQSARYLMVAVFLRGSTNPPPPDWFARCETWGGRCAREGLQLTVPKDAEQLLVFLAPQTGGDYKTLMNAVRGRPGAFVRTSQDLNQATLDRSRLTGYLTAIRSLGDSDPARLKEAAPLLARSLAIKVDEKCLEKIAVLQAPCLMEGRESLILNDGHSQSVTEALTSGPASDLAMEASSTAQLKYGYYTPFIGSIFDIARIFDSFHTAQYQYIPALTSAQGRQLALTLNAPPSFHDPKSVLVVALPAVQGAQFPPLHPVDAAEIHCARKDPLVLPVDGAPLVFATAYAHGLTLRVTGRDGKVLDLPARADAARGGLVVDTAALRALDLGEGVRASLHGYWGFDPYTGPGFQLVEARQQSWNLAPGDAAALIIGRQDTVHLLAGSVECVDDVTLEDPAGRKLKVDWKAVKPGEVEVKLPLQDVTPGEMSLSVSQYGGGAAQRVPLQAYAAAAHLDNFTLYDGDSQGVLHGTSLDQVDRLTIKAVEFLPGTLSSTQGRDELSMQAAEALAARGLRAGDTAAARVALKDGRTLTLAVTVDATRPSAALIGRSTQLPPDGGSIRLSDQDELPQDALLTFSLRALSPAAFKQDEQVEVATVDGMWSTVLSLGGGGMTLETSRVAVATLDPAKAFGPSAYGPLQYRMIEHGIAGDWRPLATLVRLPVLQALQCPGSADQDCKLSGVNLFLLASVASDAQFAHAVQVPDGYPARSLPVPHPTAGQLYVKLRDDPSVISVATLDVPAAPPPASAPAVKATEQAAGQDPRPPHSP